MTDTHHHAAQGRAMGTHTDTHTDMRKELPDPAQSKSAPSLTADTHGRPQALSKANEQLSTARPWHQWLENHPASRSKISPQRR